MFFRNLTLFRFPTSLDLTEIENRLAQLPGVTHRFTVVGENSNSVGKGQGDVTRGASWMRVTLISKPNSQLAGLTIPVIGAAER